MKILITEFMDAPAVARLSSRHEVIHEATLVDDTPRLLKLAASADAIIVRNRTQVRGELLAALARCKVVGRLGVGLDNIDLAGCEARGIRVIPATGANAQSVAEYVVATAMLLLRGAYGATAEVAAGQWPRAALTNGREIGGKTLGLVGYGSIGQLTGRLARLLGMQVVAHDAAMPAGADVPSLALDALLAQADVVSLHVPLLDSTRHLIDARRLTAMKPGAVLINTARGGVVDEAALAEALRDGHLAGAALDVFETEPLPAGSPLAGCPNLLLTPHIAGVTAEANERVSSLIADKVLEALA
ncbi:MULTISPECIES: hydroxyacid dehydrogenase [unclassified Rhizobacter]|uniref:hydroxyacid dehydrogenase n=1 Tax=unclassified Rhizobacter TaxID=2640088 RepID=UPI0006F6EC7E|nr:MULTISPECIES: hydroxyacid dehydrogenase [unclassified Rhizobacter]KQU69087.1 3-phosphoglycerate dehydrogenase [Rhizobacter sp. Root29]KQW03891.1 3-phosphoglycerate dehydrogenase [Rhizobacter sp. Root1238]KRB21530.1 3-phosphoglycerate dehydrogenase [Rhizobacter sp. Root16D2]